MRTFFWLYNYKQLWRAVSVTNKRGCLETVTTSDDHLPWSAIFVETSSTSTRKQGRAGEQAQAFNLFRVKIGEGGFADTLRIGRQSKALNGAAAALPKTR